MRRERPSTAVGSTCWCWRGPPRLRRGDAERRRGAVPAQTWSFRRIARGCCRGCGMTTGAAWVVHVISSTRLWTSPNWTFGAFSRARTQRHLVMWPTDAAPGGGRTHLVRACSVVHRFDAEFGQFGHALTHVLDQLRWGRFPARDLLDDPQRLGGSVGPGRVPGEALVGDDAQTRSVRRPCPRCRRCRPRHHIRSPLVLRSRGSSTERLAAK